MVAKNVLLVDDDLAMVRLLSRWLEGAGYQVRSAENGREAIAQIEAHCPEIVITDWEMPLMNGLELCQWIRTAHLPHYVYTIMLTMRTASADMIKALQAGADNFAKKPVDKDELLVRILSGQRLLELEHRLRSLASIDGLSGLLTRAAFHERLQAEWRLARRQRSRLACVMLDIDFFKRINDTHGHAAGDEVICAVADTLRGSCRASDLICRYGGEEFCVLLTNTTPGAAFDWALRVKDAIAAVRIPRPDCPPLSAAASFGVAELTDDAVSPQQLVEMADQALLVAKRAGRNRVVDFHQMSLPPALAASRNDLAGLLRNVSARSVMTTIVASLRKEDPVGSAARLFLHFRINSAPVVDAAGNLVGVLSEKDCMAIMLQPQWWEMKIKDVMKTSVVCYDEETSALAIYEFLSRVAMRGVVVVKEGRPTGLINRSSLLRFLLNAVAAARTGQPPFDSRSFAERDLLDGANPRDQIERAVQSLVDEAQDLQDRLPNYGHDLAPCVVGGASRLQELVNDLLACSNLAHEPQSTLCTADAWQSSA